MPRKATSPQVSSLSGKLLAKGKPDWMPASYWRQIRSVLASNLSQDETRGNSHSRPAKRRSRELRVQ